MPPLPLLPCGVQHLVAVALVAAQRCALVRVPQLQGLVAAARQAVIAVHCVRAPRERPCEERGSRRPPPAAPPGTETPPAPFQPPRLAPSPVSALTVEAHGAHRSLPALDGPHVLPGQLGSDGPRLRERHGCTGVRRAPQEVQITAPEVDCSTLPGKRRKFAAGPSDTSGCNTGSSHLSSHLGLHAQ